MARKKTDAEGLSPGPPDKVLSRIYSWDTAQNPSLDELTSWLEKVQNDVAREAHRIYAKKQLIFDADDLYAEKKIKSGDYVNLTRWKLMMPVLLDFLDVFDGTAKVLEGAEDGRVTEAFTQGVRIGLLHEKLMSLTDGRYQRLWLSQTTAPKGGKGTKELTSDDHVLLLKITYAKFRGQPKALLKTANELYEHGIVSKRGGKISQRTIRERLKEHHIWDNT